MRHKKYTLGVLLSGRGSNLQAIMDAITSGRLGARIGLVVSDNPDAYGLERARAAGLETRFIEPGPRRTVLAPEAEAEYARALLAGGVDLVCLAGFMRVLKQPLLESFPGRVLNIHPSLLPAFPGLEAWKQALEYGARFTGCTVHLVEEGVDTGPIIRQAVVPISPDDTAETLHARIQVREHLIYPEAIDLFSRDAIRVEGRRVLVGEEKPAPPVADGDARILDRFEMGGADAQSRKPSLADAALIHRLLNEASRETSVLPRSLMEIYDSLRDFIVIERKGEIIACAALRVTWEDLAEIRSLVVAAPWRRKGLGARLLKAALEEARQLQVPRVFALTDQPAFFLGQGFEPVSKNLLPHKIWSDCLKCHKFPNCDEEALWIKLS